MSKTEPLKNQYLKGQLYTAGFCRFCKKRLGDKFQVKNGSACCSDCYTVQRCSVCGEKITEGHVAFNDTLIHTGCMKCQVSIAWVVLGVYGNCYCWFIV